jgi:cytochrome P450
MRRSGRAPRSQAIQDDGIDGYRIPANPVVALSPYVTHHCERFWENPEGFDPERFTKERSAGRQRFAFSFWGWGLCIGQSFAMMEAEVVITIVAQTYRLDCFRGTWLSPNVGEHPASNGLVMTPHKRSSDAGTRRDGF